MDRQGEDGYPIVIMTEYASVTDAVKAIKMGAKDYLAKPVFHEQLVEMVKELLKPVSTIRSKEKELFKRTSPKAMEAMDMAELVAPSDISVLILGANGTGKESIARSIHFHSNRKDKPFVAVNCGAIPHELAASTFSGTQKVRSQVLMPTRVVVLKPPMAVRSFLMR